MVVYGYAKEYYYTGDGTLLIRVRIPNIHGPYKQSQYDGKSVHNYVRDKELPFYQSVLLPHLPTDGDVVALLSLNSGNSDFIVIGMTGGSYRLGLTNLGE